jgi:hypothetical protein
MAKTCNATRQDGWQNQAEHLTFTHVPLGMAALTLATKVQRRPSDKHVTHHPQPAASEPDDMSFANKRQPMYQLESRRPAPSAPQQREVQKIASALELRAQLKTLTERNELAESKIAELSMDLNAANEMLVFQQNENNSLLTSLDLMASENARQSRCLEEGEVAVKQTRTELEKVKAEFEAAHSKQSAATRSALERVKADLAACQVNRNALAAEAKSAIDRLKSDLVACQDERKRSFAGAKTTVERLKAELAAAQAESAKLSLTLDQTKAQHQTESNELKTRLSATISRAAAAEKLLKEMQRGLLAKLDSFQNSVAGKDYKIWELEQSLSKLTTATNALLQSFKSRDAALASADDKLMFLADRIAQLEADAMSPRALPQRIEMDDDSRGKVAAPQAAGEHCNEAATVSAIRQRLFEIQVSEKHGNPEAAAANFADSLLAETINF